MTLEIICSIIIFMSREILIKGECAFILIDNIKYYTKELIKLLKIIFLGLLIVIAIIMIKYRPMYSIKIGDEKIGYVQEKQIIDNYINSILEKEKNVAFIDIKEPIEYTLQLVNRNEFSDNNTIKEQIENNISIEYTTYAITYNGENKVYVSTMEDAEQLVEDIKKEYSSSYTTKIGILQVYSNNIEEIKALEIEEATQKVSKLIDNAKQEEAVKIAKASSKSAVNGVQFTVKPLSGTITSRFGNRNSPGGIGSTNHKGLDIAAKTGTTIKAAASGTVIFAGYKGSLGNLVIIDNGKNVETYYGHCSKLYVSKGQKVKAGDKIAAVGQTGTATGPHLHLEVHVNGTAVNPQKYLY